MTRAWLDEAVVPHLGDAPAGALRMFAAMVDPAGPSGWVSVVLAPAGAELAFDDQAVQHARRRVLAERWPGAVSTLLRDSSRFAGAIRFAPTREGLGDDPFARIHPARVVEVPAGRFAVVAPPAGPVIERYGSAQPWPGDRF